MRVLVVEDTARMGELIRRGLQEHGYAVDLAATGEDGLWLASENPYDAVVLDVLLPDIDGFEVCRRMREADRWSPVLMLTAKDAIADRVTGLDAGADDYLTKPFDFVELLARVRALVRRGAVERPAVIQVGELVLDPSTHDVSRAGEPIDLTTKEFALLELFMRHPDEVLSSPVAARARVGLRLRRWIERGGRLRPLPPGEDRSALRSYEPPDRAWRRLPAGRRGEHRVAVSLPLRWRLTLGFAAGMALVLIALGVFVHARLRADLTESIDEGLHLPGTVRRNGRRSGRTLVLDRRDRRSR